jgi:hypothetical protein
MSDDDDFDDILNEEDNPFDKPDMTFYSEESAYKAGFKLGLDCLENPIFIDIDIDYPPDTEEEIIESFEDGYNKGANIAINRAFSTEEDDDDAGDNNRNTKVFVHEENDDEYSIE